MIDGRKLEIQSIEELIRTLHRHPVQASAIHSSRLDAALSELRLMKRNISAVLSFTAYSRDGTLAKDPEHRRVVDEIRRECLLINGMISRIIFRRRWLFSLSKIEEVRDVLSHYQDMTMAVVRLRRFFAPELGIGQLDAF